MSDQKKYPKIEDKIRDVLSGDSQENALGFTDFLRTNEFTLKEYDEYGYGWSIEYKDKGLAFVKIPVIEKELWIWCGGVFDTDCTADDEFNETIWANKYYTGDVIQIESPCP